MSRDEIGGRGDREPFVPRGGRVALALCAVVIAASVGALRLADQSAPGQSSPDPADPTPSASATAAAPTGFPAPDHSAGRVAFIGLPPDGAAPSSPRRGELVVAVRTRLARAWLYADGRLI